MSYADEDDWAVFHDYTDWATYAAAKPNAPTLTHIQDILQECTDIINFEIGSFSTNITDSRFSDYLKKLNIRMTDRARQVELAGGKVAGFIGWSTTDYLQARERDRLHAVGRTLGYRRRGAIVF